MTPPARLNHSGIGDTVKLKGALIDPSKSFFIGGINPDGYYLLWNSADHYRDGGLWAHAAAGSHPVIR